MRSLDQQRAAHAYDLLETAPGETIDLCRRLPAMLQINGLLATWAFFTSKENKGIRTPLSLLINHLGQVRGLPSLHDSDAKALFRRWVGDTAGGGGALTGRQLRDLSSEALAFAGWLKRAAEATEPPGDTDTEDGTGA